MFEIIGYSVGFLVVSIGFVVFFGAPYVPTLKKQVDDIMKIYPLSRSDTFVDIGSGDGVVLRAAAKKGAHAIGFELSPWLYAASLILNRRHKNVRVRYGNFWRAHLPLDTTVVYTFLNALYMPKLARKLQAHVTATGQPLHFISYGFKLPGYKAVRQEGPMYLYEIKPSA